jgi:hypothetical protein
MAERTRQRDEDSGWCCNVCEGGLGKNGRGEDEGGKVVKKQCGKSMGLVLMKMGLKRGGG